MLLERESDLERLWAVIDGARQQHGGVAIVEGAPGIGKTSLLANTGARAADEGLHVLRARGTALEREFGLGILRQLFERELRDASEAERAELLAGAAGLAGPALGLTSAGNGSADGDAAFAVRHGFYWLACNVAERAPLVLVIDDAQWGDLPSLRWLAYLGGRLDGVALALLVAWRSGERDSPAEMLEALRAGPASQTVEPAALSERASAALVREAIGDRTDEALTRACHDATGGNPFLLRALIDSLRRGPPIPTGEAAKEVEELGPADVQRNVMVRLRALGDGAGQLARAVAVLDADAEPRFAYALAALDPAEGATAATALEEAQLLDVGDSLRFTHPILRAALYESLSAAARGSAHRRAAEVLLAEGGDADRAAVHLLATQPSGDRWAVQRLHEAALRAQARGAPETALALLERAIAEPAAPEVEPELLLHAGRVARLLARPDAKKYLGEAHRLARDRGVRGQAAAELARAIIHARPSEAADVLRRALASPPGDDREQADRLRLDLLTVETTGRLRPPREIEREVRAFHAEAAPGSAARLGAACVLIWHQELWEESPQAAEIAELAGELASVEPLIAAYGEDFMPLTWAASVLAEWDQPDIAAGLFAAVLEAGKRAGNAFAVTRAASSRVIHSALRGEFDEAEADARAALHSATLTGSWTGRRGAVMALVWALTARGDYEELDATLESHGLEKESGASPPVDGNLLLARSILRRSQERFAEACDDARRSMEVVPSPNPLNRINIWAPRALATGGRTGEALELSERAVAAARAGGLKGELGIALHSAGLAESGERAVELLEESCDELAGSPWQWEHAEALVDLGAALRRANRRRDARGPLREGFEHAERLGALGLAERARRELLVTGARPRGVVRSGLDSLTASERRVARMAADGLTISEIAQGLFVTRKTVETHLYSAYRKLDVHTREELTGVLAR